MMPQTLVAVGLTLIAAAILFTLVSFLIQIALPLGLALVVVGIIWRVVKPRSRDA